MRARRRSSTSYCASCALATPPLRTASAPSTGPASLPVRPLRAEARDPGRPRPDPPRLDGHGELGYSRAFAGALVFSNSRRHRLGDGPLPRAARGAAGEGGLGPRGAIAPGAPKRRLPRFCGPLPVGWIILEAGDPRQRACSSAPTASCTNFEARGQLRQPARLPGPARRGPTASTAAFTAPRGRWSRAPGRKSASGCARCPRYQRPTGASHPRSPQPYLRFDTNDYSLDPRLAGARRGRASSESPRSRSTPASSPPATAAASPTA